MTFKMTPYEVLRASFNEVQGINELCLLATYAGRMKLGSRQKHQSLARQFRANLRRVGGTLDSAEMQHLNEQILAT